jgi:hypothetical protein
MWIAYDYESSNRYSVKGLRKTKENSLRGTGARVKTVLESLPNAKHES